MQPNQAIPTPATNQQPFIIMKNVRKAPNPKAKYSHSNRTKDQDQDRLIHRRKQSEQLPSSSYGSARNQKVRKMTVDLLHYGSFEEGNQERLGEMRQLGIEEEGWKYHSMGDFGHEEQLQYQNQEQNYMQYQYKPNSTPNLYNPNPSPKKQPYPQQNPSQSLTDPNLDPDHNHDHNQDQQQDPHPTEKPNPESQPFQELQKSIPFNCNEWELDKESPFLKSYGRMEDEGVDIDQLRIDE